MSSSLMVPVIRVKNVRPHPNADRLELVDALGFQAVIRKGQFKENDLAAYFPVDVVLPDELAVKLEVDKFLSKGRVRCTKLRGEPSFGLLIVAPRSNKEGDNLAEHYQVTKYEPPQSEEAAPYDANVDPYFPKYTDIERGRIFTDTLIDGEEVVMTEKIHGTNCRVGMINGVRVAGSMNVRRAEGTYWEPWDIPGVASLLEGHTQAILFGEIYGNGFPRMQYDLNGHGFRAFDMVVQGKFMGWDAFCFACEEHNVPRVPEIYRGPFSMAKAIEMSGGQSTLANHIREGVVVKPVEERVTPTGRAILKFISEQYELEK